MEHPASKPFVLGSRWVRALDRNIFSGQVVNHFWGMPWANGKLQRDLVGNQISGFASVQNFAVLIQSRASSVSWLDGGCLSAMVAHCFGKLSITRHDWGKGVSGYLMSR